MRGYTTDYINRSGKVFSLVLLITKFLVCEPTCLMYIHSKAYPKLYWYATNDSRVVLSKSSDTLWSMEPMASLMDWISIRVGNVSHNHLTGFYMSVDKKGRVILKEVGPNEIYPWKWNVDRNNTLVIRTLERDKFADVLYLNEPIKWYNDEVKIEFTDDVTKKGVQWEGDVVKGCGKMFYKEPMNKKERIQINGVNRSRKRKKIGTSVSQRKHLTSRNVTRTSVIHMVKTTMNVTSTLPNGKEDLYSNRSNFKKEILSDILSSSTKEEFIEIRKEERICVDDGLRLMENEADATCVPARSSTAIKSLIENAYTKFTDIERNITSVTNSVMMLFVERVDTIAFNVAKTLAVTKEMNIKTKDFEIRVKRQQFPFIFPTAASRDRILVESAGENNETHGMVGLLFMNIHQTMQKEISLHNRTEKYYLCSRIISASIENNIPIKRVIIVLEAVTKIDHRWGKPVCAFWNTTGKKHFWSTIGCRRLSSERNNTRVVCECNHLTNFALLAAPVNFKIPSIHRKILSKLSLICCCISIVFLMIGITIFLLLICWQKKHTRYTIHLNLMIALFIAQVLFVTGIEATQNKLVCKSIAYLLHYFLLASFMWMLLEGLYLYFIMLKVFNNRKNNFNFYVLLLAWGLPAIIVAITGLSSNKSYGTDGYCWLSSEDFAVWAFLCPVLLIIIVNMIILFMVIHQIIILSKRDSIAHDVKMGLRSSMILLPILGVAWLIGMLSVNLETIIFQYIFAITNALQGTMITIFHCFLNGEVRRALRRLFEVCIHSTFLGNYFDRGTMKDKHKDEYTVTMTSGGTLEETTVQLTTKSSCKFIESTWDDKTNDFRVDFVSDD